MHRYWISKLRLLFYVCCKRKIISFKSLSVFIDTGVRFLSVNGFITVGGQAHFSRNCTVKATDGSVMLGNRFSANENTRIIAHDSITIGRNCIIADNVSIYDHDHRFTRTDIPFVDQGFTHEPIRIGNNVWIGSHSIICKGVTIGDNVVIAAGAVVNKDVPSGTVAGGVPARVLRLLTDT